MHSVLCIDYFGLQFFFKIKGNIMKLYSQASKSKQEKTISRQHV